MFKKNIRGGKGEVRKIREEGRPRELESREVERKHIEKRGKGGFFCNAGVFVATIEME